MTIADPTDFADALLKALNDPVTPDNVADIKDWEQQEGGNWDNSAAYNPLNTTLQEQGSSSINSVGVQSYDSWSQGLGATVSTLTEQGGEEYPDILTALAQGNLPPSQFGELKGLGTWGTGVGDAVFGDSGGSGAASTGASGTAPVISTTTIGKILTELDGVLNPQTDAGILGDIPIIGTLINDTDNVVLTVVMRALFTLMFAGVGAAGLVLLIRKPVGALSGIALPIARTVQSGQRLQLAQQREERITTQTPQILATRQQQTSYSGARTYANLDPEARRAYDSHRRNYG